MATISIEERLCAAANTILNDGQHHSDEVRAWAAQCLAENTRYYAAQTRHVEYPRFARRRKRVSRVPA